MTLNRGDVLHMTHDENDRVEQFPDRAIREFGLGMDPL